MNSSEKFISRIKEENIKPIPRWRYTIRNLILWFTFLLSVIVGALAFSIILFAIQQIEFSLIKHMTHSRMEMWLGLLPFLWIITMLVFLLISIFGLKKTRKGYKFSAKKVIAASAITSILLGTLFFVGGGAKWLENAFAMNVEFYEGVNEKKMKMWSIPEEGYISGYIVSVEDSTIQLKDFNESIWTVNINNAKIFAIVELVEGEKIKIIGEMISKDYFTAEEVRPWGGFGQNGKGRGKTR